MSQSSTGLATSQVDTISHWDKQASVGSFRPFVPPWFLDNVRTLAELQQLDPCLELVDDAIPNPPESKSPLDGKSKSTSDHFGIERLAIEDVLDMTAALHITPTPTASEFGIVLLSKMRFGYDLLDRVVVTMAREVGSSIITLTSSELEDIAVDFLRQRNHYHKEHPEHSHEDGNDSTKLISDATEYFFGNQSRRHAEKSATDRNTQAIFAILNAATAKMEAGESMNLEEESPSIILYVRDMSFDSLTLQRRVLCRIRDAVSQRRQDGQRVTLVMGLAHTEAEEDATVTNDQTEIAWLKMSCSCHLCEYENGECCGEYNCPFKTVRRKLTDQDMSCFVLEPHSVPKEWPKQRAQSWPPSLVTANIQSFKRYLRQNLPGISPCPPGFLEAQSDWTTSLPINKLKYFFPGAQDEAIIVNKIARTYAVGRGLRQRSMCMTDVEAAFTRAELSARSRGLLKSQPTETEESSEDEEKIKPIWRQRIAAILPRCNAQEQALLSNIVDLDSLEGKQDDIDVGEGLLENLSRLVSQTATSAASAVSRNSRVNGALLYGPPGTGKTLLARVLAKKTGTPMITLDASTVYSKWIGEAEKAIAAAFSLGQKLSPCIIFIDEVDALFFRRSDNDSSWHRQALNQFLQSMDGLRQGDDAPFVLGATNRPFDLDSAFLRRLPYQIEFTLPNAEARARILRMILGEERLDPDISVNSLATMTKDFTGSDLRNLYAQASLACSIEHSSKPPSSSGLLLEQRVASRHFAKALEMTHASVSLSDMQAITKFRDVRGTALQTAAMMRILVEKKPSTNDITDQDSDDPASSSSGDDNDRHKLEGEYHVESQTANTPPQGDDQVQMVPESVIEKVEAGRESDVDSWEMDVDVRCDAEKQQPATEEQLLKQQREEKDQKTTASEMIKISQGLREQDILVSSFSDQSSQAVALPVLQPPPGCLNRPRRVYPYESLPTDMSIRVLRVELPQSGGSESLKEPVRCSLHVVHLRDQPDYFALSYTWGDPRTIHTRKEDVLSDAHWGAPAFEIYCDSNPVSVSTNLYTAIVSLRVHFASGSLAAQYGEKYKPQGHDHFYIWVDAICINQDNLDEKGQQISMMSQIYGDCRFSRSWFTRAWIMQEWALSSNAVLICGDILINPLKFAFHFDEVQGRGWKSSMQVMICGQLHSPWYKKDDNHSSDWLASFAARIGERIPNRLYASGGKDHDHQKAVPDGSILHVSVLQAMVDHDPKNYSVLRSIFATRMVYEITIDFFRSLQCSDPRDKVYAFHGMFRHEDGSAVLSTPDYNKTVSEVYLEASKVIFKQIGVRILCKREKRYDFPSELPTWALDLRMDHENLFNAQAKHYKASRGMGKQDEAALKDSNIVVNGYQIDTVNRASVFPSGGHNSQATFAELLDVLSCLPETTHIVAQASTDRQMALDGRIYPQDRSEVFWRTLLFDQSEAQYPIPARFGAELRDILQEKLQEKMTNLVSVVVYELLLPLAKKTEAVVANSTCNGPDISDMGYKRLCEVCKLKAELSLMLKNQVVAVSDPIGAATEVLDCFSAISKLNGDTPIDSSERLEPPFWREYLALVDELRTAAAEEENFRFVASRLEALRDWVRSMVPEPTASAHLRDRVLFATSEGRLGVSSGPIQTGDGVWLLAGLQYPIILRQAINGTHFVVHCAYVHGIMHGEAVPVDEPPVLVELA
ncbi:atpase family aaa domain-containing protein [Fusarium heterosporum]|uniref:Atpase family aaa domain-containing protein n=1 Tax=Fusarium heterosporum TaxID=42747 RepID=A0A8H5T2B0_FUSHE|nr:atpase family aaa domain-containing protein [Fusarium heterosporum]